MTFPFVLMALVAWVVVPHFIESIAYKKWLLPVQVAVPIVAFVLFSSSQPESSTHHTPMADWIVGACAIAAAYYIITWED